MCLAYPMKIIKINGTSALVEAMGVKKDVDISLIDNPEINDRLIIHAGFAIEKLSPEDADKVEKKWSELLEFLENNSSI